MNDDSSDDSQRRASEVDLEHEQAVQRNSDPVDSVAQARIQEKESTCDPDMDTDTEGTEQSTVPIPRAKGHGFSLRSLLQIRLSLLLLLFIPVALYFKGYTTQPEVTYIEDKDLFWEDGFTEIDFTKKTDGTPLARQAVVDSAFQDLGVTFAKGLPLRKPETETAPGLIQANHLRSQKEQKNLKVNKKAQQPSGSKTDSSNTPVVPSTTSEPKPAGQGYIGIAGYPFRFPNYHLKPASGSICVFDTSGTYIKRFKGSMTIRFHKPGKPDKVAGVNAIGFYAARLNHPEAIEVRAYNYDGVLLCRQKNIADRPCALMSLKSKTLISRIEIEAVGMDRDYAVAGLMFDKVKTPGISNQR